MEQLRATYQLEIKWTHFPLHPDTPEEGFTLEQLFAGRKIDISAAKAQMEQLMATEGLSYGDRTMTYNSRLAQELAHWAEVLEAGDRIHDELFRAYFVDNKNLAHLDTLVDLADELGLPRDEARDVLLSRKMSHLVDADWRRARTMGIQAVPSFLAADRLAVGAQPYPVLEELVLAARAGRRT
ncbi:MAG: hypothetical protein CMJ81_22155 [Planctomycetaceae bacterium]|nr:hypothetical protein [Planctomycetaceae bacterium]